MDRKSTRLGHISGDENRTGMYKGKILAIKACRRSCVFGEAVDVQSILEWEDCIVRKRDKLEFYTTFNKNVCRKDIWYTEG